MRIILLTLILSSITSGCGVMNEGDGFMNGYNESLKTRQKVDELVESIREDTSIEKLKVLYAEQQPVFLDLHYIDSREIESFGEPYEEYLPEFTWWFELSTDYDSAFNHIWEEYSVELPYVENMEGRRFVISLGRKLSQLYYYEMSGEYTYNKALIGRPIFEEQYYPLTIFFYTINFVDRFGFINDIYTPDMEEFNINKNIPYEVKPFEPMGGIVLRDTGDADRLRRWVEEDMWIKYKAEQQ